MTIDRFNTSCRRWSCVCDLETGQRFLGSAGGSQRCGGVWEFGVRAGAVKAKAMQEAFSARLRCSPRRADAARHKDRRVDRWTGSMCIRANDKDDHSPSSPSTTYFTHCRLLRRTPHQRSQLEERTGERRPLTYRYQHVTWDNRRRESKRSANTFTLQPSSKACLNDNTSQCHAVFATTLSTHRDSACRAPSSLTKHHGVSSFQL